MYRQVEHYNSMNREDQGRQKRMFESYNIAIIKLKKFD